MPAETPAVMTMCPLSTKRTPSRTLAFGAASRSQPVMLWKVVASSPSRKPLSARQKAALQTEKAISTFGTCSRTKRASGPSPSRHAVSPPGITRMSGGGQSPVVKSGTTVTMLFVRSGLRSGPTV
jgi:hypothetical protein